ncbi:serine hydrolase domain-containing protein [Streptodolium elevatio]|uniref:Serine hydrolase domain-containing protein n=1 Tax=Streptodolium elevatio TaxID=3157996 RepID=A0ABV3D8U1_9ACTN
MNGTRSTSTPEIPSGTSHAAEPGITLRIHPVNGPTTQASLGLASLELVAPVEATTVFNVGSVAKQITAYLCVRAVQDGRLNLDRPVSEHLPRFQIPDVSVRDLIRHRGGVRDAESLLSLAGFRDLDHYTGADLLELAYRQDHRAVPPGHFLYSNTGYLLLAEILRQIHGGDLQDIAQQQVFNSLGMNATRFKRHPTEVIPGAASSYGPDGGGWSHQQRPVTLPGPGSLWCSAADLDRWLAHLADEWRRAASTSPMPFDGHVSYQPSDHTPFTYGAGLYADPRRGRTAVFHYGHEQGFSAATHLTPWGLRIVCLSNRTDMPADHILATVLAEIVGNPDVDADQLLASATQNRRKHPTDTQPDAGPNLGPEEPHTILGTYECEAVPGTLRLSLSAGVLHLWRRGAREPLQHTSQGQYTSDSYTLTFPAAQSDDAEFPPGEFILDLRRAPDLRYRLKPGTVGGRG